MSCDIHPAHPLLAPDGEVVAALRLAFPHAMGVYAFGQLHWP